MDTFNPTIFMTISLWSSIASWEAWEKDSFRTTIVEQITELLQGKPSVQLWLDDEDAQVGATCLCAASPFRQGRPRYRWACGCPRWHVPAMHAPVPTA